MPLEVAIVAPVAADLDLLQVLAAQRVPALSVDTEFDGSCIVFRNPGNDVVAMLQRPQRVGYRGDLARCCDAPVPEAETASAWTEGCVPFAHGSQGLEMVAAVAVATRGRMLVKGVQD